MNKDALVQWGIVAPKEKGSRVRISVGAGDLSTLQKPSQVGSTQLSIQLLFGLSFLEVKRPVLDYATQ
jgi:hypothetical protein